MIDLTWLTTQVAAAVVPALPMLLGKVGEGVSDELRQDAVELARTLWARLRPAVEERPAAREAAQDVADDPKNEDAQGALRQQLRKLLIENPELQRDLAKVVSEAEARGVPSLHVEASGTRAVAIGGSNLGTIRTGDEGSPAGGRE